MLKLNKVTKIYNKQKVLNEITIDFRDKEFVVILGESGSGKTTLLNIISAIEKPDTGEMLLGETNIFSLNLKKLDIYRNNFIDYIFQSYNLINYLNIEENIKLASKIKKLNITNKEINRILSEMKIDNITNNNISTLSGGEKQRGAIARSILNKSKILLCDEPTGAVDSNNAFIIMGILKKISKNKLVIMVTHNEKLALKYADRIIKLKDGRVIQDTNPYESSLKAKFEFKKTNLSYLTTLKTTFKNLKFKRLRTFLVILAFSIGLISLSLVLGISNGFNDEIKKVEKETLFNYPLTISKENYLVDNLFKKEERKYKKNYINIKDEVYKVRNEIDEKLFDKLLKIEKIEGISCIRNINSSIKEYLIQNPGKNIFNLLEGVFSSKKTDLMLMINDKNSINQTLANYLDIKEIKLSKIINKEIKINEKTFKIVGVIKSKNDFYKDSFGLVYNENAFKEEITDVIIFPKDYKSKMNIKENLKEYNIIDESQSIVNILQKLIKGISYVLISFSGISLIVSVIMISIISYISVLERTKEIGILKSLGANSKDIKKLFLSENIIIGFITSIITIKIVKKLEILINNMIYKKIEIKNLVNFNFKTALFIIMISITLSYIAGLIPSRIASKKKVIDILNNKF